MPFAVTEVQRLFADTLARLFLEDGFEARRARLAQTPAVRNGMWPALVKNGVLGAFFPEDAGGFGGGPRDVAVIFHEVGKTLAVVR